MPPKWTTKRPPEPAGDPVHRPPAGDDGDLDVLVGTKARAAERERALVAEPPGGAGAVPVVGLACRTCVGAGKKGCPSVLYAATHSQGIWVHTLGGRK